jgi:hypothetical protein
MSDPAPFQDLSPTPLPGWAARNERRKFVASLFWGLAAAVAGFGIIRPGFEAGFRNLHAANAITAVSIFAVLCVASYILLGQIEDK